MYYQALEYENELLMAGTLKKTIDIDSAIERCMEIVSHESDIVIDVILMSSVGREVLTKADGKLSAEYSELAEQVGRHSLVTFRYLMAPDEHAIKDYEWKNFDNNWTKRMYEMGKREGEKAINDGQGKRFHDLKSKK